MRSDTNISTLFSNVPCDILVSIYDKLVCPEDLIAFLGVCKPWRSAVGSKRLDALMMQLLWPWLVLAQKKGDTDHCEFYVVSKNKTFRLKLPEAYDKRCLESKEGWLITIARDSSVHLLHPLSRLQIQLPPLNSNLDYDDPPHRLYVPPHRRRHPHGHDNNNNDDGNVSNNEEDNFYFIHRAALSSPTSSNSRIVMVIYGVNSVLAFCIVGENGVAADEWTKINFRVSAYRDVFHYKEGKFYAIDWQHRIVSFDVTGPNPTAPLIHTIMPEEYGMVWQVCYLVDTYSSSSPSNDDTLLEKVTVVSRMAACSGMVSVSRKAAYFFAEDGSDMKYGTTGFRVFEVDLLHGIWTEVKNIGNKTLFLGHNSSFYIDSNNDNEIKPNCIYFVGDIKDQYSPGRDGGRRDMGIYCLQDGSSLPCFKDQYSPGRDGGRRDMGIYCLQDGSFSPHFKDQYSPGRDGGRRDMGIYRLQDGSFSPHFDGTLR